jgi:hypothetical protein
VHCDAIPVWRRIDCVKRPVLAALLSLPVAGLMVGCGSQMRAGAPFVKSEGTEAGGWAVLGLGPKGTMLRFVPKTSFGIGVVLRNRTKEDVTLVDVRTVDPPQSLVQQQGTTLTDWNPPPCSGNHSCPAIGFLRGPFDPAKAEPIAVKSGKQAAVQLDFMVDGCAAVPFASPGAAREIAVFYRVGSGHVQQQLIPLGGSRLELRMPSARDCAPRPRSSISVSGPYATSSDWTIPISSGDNCDPAAHGGMLFASRLYQSPTGPSVRVRIHLPHFRGVGLYRSVGKAAPALGPAAVDAIVGIGIHGSVTFPSSSGVVTVTAVTKRMMTGRFHATIAGRRHTTFRAYGAWRCLIR